MVIRFHCYKMTWLKDGKHQVTMLAGIATRKDILQCAKDLGAKIIALTRITDKRKIKKLEKQYIASHN